MQQADDDGHHRKRNNGLSSSSSSSLSRCNKTIINNGGLLKSPTTGSHRRRRSASLSIVQRFQSFFENAANQRAASASPNNSSSIPISPHNFESITSEQMLNGVIAAFPHLQFSSLQLDVSTSPMPSAKEFWQILMSNFESAVEMGLEYVKLLPGISYILPSDRRLVFSECLLPMAAIQQILNSPRSGGHQNDTTTAPPGELYFLNMTPQARQLFLTHFPTYETLAKEVYDIAVAIANWAPSSVEIAFIEALLFYHSELPGLSNPVAVERLRNCLLKTIDAHLRSTYGEEKAISALDQILSVYKLLMRLPEVHASVLWQMTNNNADIVKTSPLLGEVYPSEQLLATSPPVTPTTANGSKKTDNNNLLGLVSG